MKNNLSPYMKEKLGHYVYLYVNPFDGKIFYVGKGQKDRVISHLDDTEESKKVRMIKKIRQAGKEPLIEILAHQLPSESAALRIEAAVIDTIGLENLTNNNEGWHWDVPGRDTLEAMIALYEAKPVKIVDPVILIRINRKYYSTMSADELYEVTRGIWKVAPKRNKARFAFAVYKQVVREVYAIQNWFPAGTTPYSYRDGKADAKKHPGRWEFTGTLADEEIRKKYINKSVAKYLPAHARAPFIYINCAR